MKVLSQLLSLQLCVFLGFPVRANSTDSIICPVQLSTELSPGSVLRTALVPALASEICCVSGCLGFCRGFCLGLLFVLLELLELTIVKIMKRFSLFVQAIGQVVFLAFLLSCWPLDPVGDPPELQDFCHYGAEIAAIHVRLRITSIGTPCTT